MNYPEYPEDNKFYRIVRQANSFEADRDAEVLHKAMKGFGTDEKAIIQVLANRDNNQRQEIALQFKSKYGKDLISDLKSELSVKLENLIVALMTPTYDYLAKELHHAVDGIRTNEETIIDIMCTSFYYEIEKIKSSYKNLFGKDLEKVLMGETSGSFRRLLVSLCQGNRSKGICVDDKDVKSDVQTLLGVGDHRCDTDESKLMDILCNRSYSQLQQIFWEYQRTSGKNFEDVIRNELSGNFGKGLIAIVKSVTNKSLFFAKRLHESMSGLGTNDRVLIRIVATRSEIDMVDIKNAYMSLYGKSLEADIANETSGDYKKCLTALALGCKTNIHNFMLFNT